MIGMTVKLRLLQGFILAILLAPLLLGVKGARAQEAEAFRTSPFVIGVLSQDGATRTIETWLPMIEELNRTAEVRGLPFSFTLEPHTRESLNQELAEERLDLVLSDPSYFVIGEVEQGARALLSLADTKAGASLAHTGALAFSLAGSGIQRFDQVRGQRVMASHSDEVMGWKLVQLEAARVGVDLYDGASSIIYSGNNQRDIVYAVRNGLADVGVVRIGLLEDLADEGVIDLEDYQPIARRTYPDSPLWGSTDVFPNSVLWTFPGMPEAALAHVIDVLLALDQPTTGESVWQAPQNYQRVHELLIGLRVRPYENHILQAFLRIYADNKWIIRGLTVLILFSFALLMVQVRRNIRLREESKDLLRSEIRSKQFYRNAIEEHTVFAMLDRQGALTHVNAHLRNLVDRDRKALINQSFKDLLGAADFDRFDTEIMDAMEAGANWVGALRLENGEGGRAYVNCTFIPIQTDGNQLSEIAIVASDVSEIRERVTRQSLSDTLELIRDQVVVLRPETYDILYANAAAEAGLARKRMGGTWQGQTVEAFITEEDFERLKERAAEVQAAPQQRVTWEAETKNDVYYEISLEWAAPSEGEPLLIAIYRDVSERRKIERTKSEFVATVSHELRTPLTSIQGALGLVNSGAAGTVPPKIEKLIKMAASNCNRLAGLVEDILDLDQIDAEKLKPNMQELDLEEIVSVVLARNALMLQHHTISVTREPQAGPDMLTFGDPMRLIQAMENLLSNAVKFSPRGTEIVLGLVDQGSFLQVSVLDHGSGIPERAQASVFDRFTQADSSDTRSQGGTGLGLSIVKLIMEAHGGRVTFASLEGRGTQFLLDLPKSDGEKALPMPPETAEKPDLRAILGPMDRADLTVIEGGPEGPENQLLRRIRAKGLRVLTSDNSTAGELALGTQLPDWLEVSGATPPFARIADESGPERPAILLELGHFHGETRDAQVTATLLADLLADWLNSSGEGDLREQPLNVTLQTDSPEQKDAFARHGMTGAAEGGGPADLQATLTVKEENMNLLIAPQEGGRAPEEWPVVILGIRLEQSSETPGMVSKFAPAQSRKGRN